MNSRYLSVLAMAGTCGAVPLGRAAESLRHEEAVARAMANNPSLEIESARLRAIQAGADPERLPTPYVVSGELENVGGTGALNGINASETNLRLERMIERGDKREARQALARAEVVQQHFLSESARIDSPAARPLGSSRYSLIRSASAIPRSGLSKPKTPVARSRRGLPPPDIRVPSSRRRDCRY